MLEDHLMKQLKESWARLEENPEKMSVADDLRSLYGFDRKKLNWLLEKLKVELNKEMDRTRNDRTNSQLEVVLVDSIHVILTLLNHVHEQSE